MTQRQWINVGFGVALGAVLIGGGSFLFKVTMTPRILTATRAEVLAVVPKELLTPVPVDKAAEARFRQFVDTCGRLKLMDIVKLQNKPASEVGLTTARKLWFGQAPLISQLKAILAAGNLKVSETHREESWNNAFSEIILATRALSACSKEFAGHGDPEDATDCLCLNLKISDSYRNAECYVMDARIADLIQTDVLKDLRNIVCRTDLPATDCERLLRSLPPAPKEDKNLANAILAEFQQFTLSRLQDPVPYVSAAHLDGSIVGNYNPIETAMKCGQEKAAVLRNTALPYAEMDMREVEILRKEAAELPVEFKPADPAGNFKIWDKLNYRIAMNRTLNSIGRAFLSRARLDQEVLSNSCRSRALCEATRAMLAIRLYMSAHKGAAPTDLQALVPKYLAALPYDPFIGKPLRLNLAESVVYSVGENLVDDGGDIGKFRDIGVSYIR
jgi:hypothetical protein